MLCTMLHGMIIRCQWVQGGDGVEAGLCRICRISTSGKEKEVLPILEQCQQKNGGRSGDECV